MPVIKATHTFEPETLKLLQDQAIMEDRPKSRILNQAIVEYCKRYAEQNQDDKNK